MLQKAKLLKKSISLLLLGLAFFSCKKGEKSYANYYSIPTDSDDGINVVVEIPAGTNHKIEYDPKSNSFPVDQKNGKDRVVEFLPYPGNYGFIPSTLMDKKRGGDGDALDVLIIGESKPTGSVVGVRPIATLLLLDGGEIDTKIIAIPTDSSAQIIQPADFQEFIVRYDAVRMIIEKWFLNYKGAGIMKLLGWQDDGYALREIEKWRIKKAADK